MYRKEIEEYIDSHKDQMIEDICTLCRINSEKMPYTEGKPFGEGPFEVLQTALTMMENYGFSVRNYDNYVGTADLNDKEAQLDILAHLDVVPAGEGWTVTCSSLCNARCKRTGTSGKEKCPPDLRHR